MELFPWQYDDYQSLIESFHKQSFTTLLVHGSTNSGAESLIDNLINYMLCLEPLENIACKKCNACILYQENNHPDLAILTADIVEDRKTNQIKVEQIRGTIDFAYRSNHISKFKVIYLPNALELNLNSSNALLKLLEEPPSNCIFILKASNINQILPTIKSRAFKYRLATPKIDQALLYVDKLDNHRFWLNYFEGEPFFTPPLNNEQLESLQKGLLIPSIEVLFELSRTLDPKKIGAGTLYEFLIKWLSDLMIVAKGGQAKYFNEFEGGLIKLSQRLNFNKLYNLQDDLVFLTIWQNHPLNHKLQFENVLFKYQQLYA